MGILSLASRASLWRGYEYYTEHKVCSCKQLDADEYEGTVAGSAGALYNVKINTAHARKSTCDCPHAAGRRIICKHMVALYFAAFPDEAQVYRTEVEEREREFEERELEREKLRNERYEELKKYVFSLSKEELQEQLLSLLLNDETDNYDDDDDYWFYY